MATVGAAYQRVRVKLASKAGKILADTCRLIVDGDEYPDTPCEFKGGSDNLDAAPYRVRLPWNSPAIIGATVIIDAIPGREQLTLQLSGPADSSKDLWQEWRATGGPGSGRTDVGL
jgi:hypothetical protein